MLIYIWFKYLFLFLFVIRNEISCIQNDNSLENSKEFMKNKLGNYTGNLTSLELQKKIRKCSFLINQVKKKLILIEVKIEDEKTTFESKNLDNHKEEFIDKISDINNYCNKFINLLLLKRIVLYLDINQTLNLEDEELVNKKVEEIIDKININQENASFFRSLILKTKCDHFQLNIACKKLTNKLLYYLAITPNEIIENFDNTIIEDSN